MIHRVFVTGGRGFVGSAIIAELVSRQMQANALLNVGKLAKADPSVLEIPGDLFVPDSLDRAMQGCEAAIHLVGIIAEIPKKNVTFERIHVEGTRAVVDAAKRNGIRRYIHMSALGARPKANSAYHQTKFKAEEYVRGSGLDWTIFRPSLIHGPGGLMAMEAAWARKSAPPFLFMPYFGKGIFGLGGSGLLQPIYVRDVARAFADALTNPASIGKTYELPGPENMTWQQLHAASARAIVGHRRLIAPMPAWLARCLAAAGLGPLLKFSADQVIMSQEDNVGDLTAFERDFESRPERFETAVGKYVTEL